MRSRVWKKRRISRTGLNDHSSTACNPGRCRNLQALNPLNGSDLKFSKAYQSHCIRQGKTTLEKTRKCIGRSAFPKREKNVLSGKGAALFSVSPCARCSRNWRGRQIRQTSLEVTVRTNYAARRYGSACGPVIAPVFKTGGRHLRCCRCVRLTHASANFQQFTGLEITRKSHLATSKSTCPSSTQSSTSIAKGKPRPLQNTASE